MAQYAGGKLRLTAKHSNGRVKAASGQGDYTIWDNTTVPRICIADVQYGTAQGSADDQVMTPSAALFADGSKGEMLDVEFYHTAAATTITTANHNFAVQVADTYFVGQEMVVEEVTLYVGDRVTKSTSGTRNHQRGWPDNTINQAYQNTPMVRFMPEPGHVWSPRGFQYAVIDGA